METIWQRGKPEAAWFLLLFLLPSATPGKVLMASVCTFSFPVPPYPTQSGLCTHHLLETLSPRSSVPARCQLNGHLQDLSSLLSNLDMPDLLLSETSHLNWCTALHRGLSPPSLSLAPSSVSPLDVAMAGPRSISHQHILTGKLIYSHRFRVVCPRLCH